MRGRTGMTTVLTTHYLDAAERPCDRIAVMHQAAIVALDRPAALLAGLGAELVELRVDKDPDGALASVCCGQTRLRRCSRCRAAQPGATGSQYVASR
jgi:ABC-type multidrug transport system ATPase subunit